MEQGKTGRVKRREMGEGEKDEGGRGDGHIEEVKVAGG